MMRFFFQEVLVLWRGSIFKQKKRIFLTGACIPNAILLGTREYCFKCEEQ